MLTAQPKHFVSKHFAVHIALFAFVLAKLVVGGVQFNQQRPDGQPLVSSSFGIPGKNATYDFVVAGGGTAGLALAARLAAANLSVAVVEPGGFYELDNGNDSIVPNYAALFTGSEPGDFQPLIDWGFDTEPQAALGNRIEHYARGKTLGGSSARNYLLYHRPTIGSLQQWADQVGDQEWNWEGLLPFYKKSVMFDGLDKALHRNSNTMFDASAFLPPGGPIQVSLLSYVNPFGAWSDGLLPLVGMNYTDGFNSGRLLGSSYAIRTIDARTGRRSSSETSYLEQAFNGHSRGFITIYKSTLATEILFNGSAATGLAVTTAGTFGTPSVNFTLSAGKEVVLAAGAFQSPQLLMVSGIGNCTELARFGIECKVDAPGVGKNMWDQPALRPTQAVKLRVNLSAAVNNMTSADDPLQQYLETGGGPFSAFGLGFYGFEKLPEPYRSQLSNATRARLDSTFPEDWPELEWLPQAAQKDPDDGKYYATLVVALVAPLSRGTVELRSASMTDPPKINPAWLSDDGDREMAIQAVKRTQQIWAKLVEVGVAEPGEGSPGPEVQTDEQVWAWIKETVSTVWHASATCKMGRVDDPMAVVDSEAFVRGVERLRVVDAAAFPFLPPGHPQSTVYAFAEKIADTILSRME